MLKKLGIVAGVLLVLLAIGLALQPATYRVERSVVIAAPPTVVFPFVDDFHLWPQWSPFEKLDPQMTRTFGGAPSGVGATYAWSGNSDAGSGQMTITEAVAGQRVALDLHFMEPMESNALTEFSFVPEGQGTKVTWAMSGPNTIPGRALSLFYGMDRMIGPDFEDGLAKLKDVSETAMRLSAEAR